MSALDKKIERLRQQRLRRPHDKQAENAYYRLVNKRTEWLRGLYVLFPEMKPPPMKTVPFDAILKAHYNNAFIRELASAQKNPWFANLGRDKY